MDQGAAGRCENFTKASGTDETAKKSPPLSTARARTSSGGGGSWSGHQVQFLTFKTSDFQKLRFPKPTSNFDRIIFEMV